jgi:hypothetical protein
MMADPPITITGLDGQKHTIGPDDPNYASAKAAAQYATAVNAAGPGDSSGFLAAMAKVAEKYPTLLNFLKTQPELLTLYLQSINETWSPEQLQSKLYATNYYKSTTQDQRSWDQLIAQDPATAQQRYQTASQHNTQLWQQGGYSVPYATFLTINNQAVRGNWSDDTIKAALNAAQKGLPPPTTNPGDSGIQGGGDIGANMNLVKQIAASYAVPVSNDAAYQWALNLQSGAVDQNGVQAWAKEQAASLFPGLKTALDAGLTVDQYASPYKSVAQQELGINPNDISWTDPKWNAALNQIDAKTGARVSMSLSDWTTKLRSDPTYGYDQTPGAKDQARTLATKIQSVFGNTGMG